MALSRNSTGGPIHAAFQCLPPSPFHLRLARRCRIESNGQGAKAAREVRVGDRLQVKNDGGDFQVEVLVVSEMRGPAAVAQTLYQETKASRELRLKLAEERKAMPHFESLREGKPSKRDRREIERFRGRA
jgi:ribosome-associated heat shock protein Hsp15